MTQLVPHGSGWGDAGWLHTPLVAAPALCVQPAQDPPFHRWGPSATRRSGSASTRRRMSLTPRRWRSRTSRPTRSTGEGRGQGCHTPPPPPARWHPAAGSVCSGRPSRALGREKLPGSRDSGLQGRISPHRQLSSIPPAALLVGIRPAGTAGLLGSVPKALWLETRGFSSQNPTTSRDW